MSITDIINDSWGWTGIKAVDVIEENDFGNLIIKDMAGKYWRLCPEDIYCKIVAENRNKLDSLFVDSDFLIDWSMESLVSEAKTKFGPLQPGKKFHFVVPAILGGEYIAENICTVTQVEQIKVSGQIGKQIDKLPDGSEVLLKIVD